VALVAELLQTQRQSLLSEG